MTGRVVRLAYYSTMGPPQAFEVCRLSFPLLLSWYLLPWLSGSSLKSVLLECFVTRYLCEALESRKRSSIDRPRTHGCRGLSRVRVMPMMFFVFLLVCLAVVTLDHIDLDTDERGRQAPS